MEEWSCLTSVVIAQAVRGDAEARGVIASLALPRIRLMVLARLSPSPSQLHHVDDLVQSAAQGLMQGLQRLQQQNADGLRRFLSSIVTHRVADFLAAKARPNPGPAASLEETVHRLGVAGAMAELMSASGTTPSGAAARSEQVARVLAELGRLPERHREAIILAFFDQVPTSVIAERLSITRPAASMLLIRALRALRRSLTGGSAVVPSGAAGGRPANDDDSR